MFISCKTCFTFIMKMYLYSDGKVGDYLFWDDFVMKL